MISYEHPLNERIRTLLRLEDLYHKALYFSAKGDAEEHHVALTSIFEILDVASRADLKSDLLQELDRQKHALEPLRSNPAISEQALNGVLGEIDRTITALWEISGKIGQHIRDNEWLMSIKQRAGIPGGVCQFDLPSYHCWLSSDPGQRRRDLGNWIAPLLPIRDGLGILLKLLRESGKSATHVAGSGVFQQMLTGKLSQLLRVTLESNLASVPEISANKYALNIRFITQSGDGRPRTAEGDIEFRLTFCNL